MDKKDNIIDFQLIKAASELEAELTGIFGITADDIQKAAERMISAGLRDPRENLKRLSPALRSAIPLLDALKSLAEDYAHSDDEENLLQLKEVMRHYCGMVSSIELKSKK